MKKVRAFLKDEYEAKEDRTVGQQPTFEHSFGAAARDVFNCDYLVCKRGDGTPARLLPIRKIPGS